MIARYWHTLRYLRPVQFFGRLWFRLYCPKPDLRPAPAVRPVPGHWVPPVAKPVSLLGPTTFRFLNETHELAGAGHEVAGGGDPWNDSVRDKLWLYNLHYFDDLHASPSPPTPPPRRGEGGKKLGFDTEGCMPAAQVSSLPPSPLVGEGWGEGEHTGSTQRQQWHLALLQRWVNENPPGHGNGWEPYPTSLRIVNWIKWSLTSAPEGGGVAVALPPACLRSLAVQARWLSRRLEHHLLGNHLFANAKALVFAGAFFVGPEADRWRTLGLRLLARELEEQILPDGGHFERSPMYHAILLEDVLDLINLAGAYPGLFGAVGSGSAKATLSSADQPVVSKPIPGAPIAWDSQKEPVFALWRAKATAMLNWLAAMTHPDGEISFFNDAAMGIAPPLAALVAYAERLGIAAAVAPALPCCWLRDSGYVRLAVGPAVALLDVAPIGPDYLPGHAHADTLSFELSLFGQRVIVNGGTSRYGGGPERLAERGTAAHSTVQLDGADSSEVWGGFRVARRARVLGVRVRQGEVDLASVSDDGLPARPVMVVAAGASARTAMVAEAPAIAASGTPLQVSAAHDGYRRLPGRPVHHRAWDLTEDRYSVTDAIAGEYRTAIARFHLHPAIRVAMDPGGDGDQASGYLYLPGGQQVRWQLAGGAARLVPDAWHPQFGLSEAAQCLELRLASAECRLHLEWGRGALPGDEQVPPGC